uniref:Uncharacterized protein n=1 Tax=Wallerfield virus TaxID=1457165 RepID=A0A1U7EJG3_9VIRU|nr:hypothetical protein 3 [Wallerfield virus]AQM55509.1 hypothetical protein 3 [Wallerfield virus]AQM55512.1 hypothetical protein 3 [Wallerfield virus]
MALQRTGTVVKPRAVAARTVSAPRTATVKAKLTRLRDSANLDFSKFFDYATNILTDTTFMVFFVLSAYLCFNYTTKGTSSMLVAFVDNFIKHFSSFSDSKCSILGMLLVGIPFAPAILTVNPKNRFGAILCTVLYYVFIPERTVYEYLVHGALVYLILRTSNKQFKLIGVGLLFLSYVMQFAIPLPSGDGYSCNVTKSE